MRVRNIQVVLFLLFLVLAFPKQTLAIGEDWGSCVVNGVATLGCVPVVFKNIINFALFFAGGTALVTIMIGGVKYIFSRGDPKAVEAAKSTIQWGIIGTVVIVLAFSIIKLIAFFTGTSCFLEFGFTSCNP